MADFWDYKKGMSRHGYQTSFCDLKMYEAKLTTRGEHDFYVPISISSLDLRNHILRELHS